jgi:uncharacterized membrane protein
MPQPNTEYEATPLTRAEYIAAIVHLYRGELHRSTLWRIRLDTTTNWAILTVAGLLAFSFRDATNPHWAVLIGLMLVTLLMGYEARRFRFFDMWRARVRKIEKNFYGPILRRDPVSPEVGWGTLVAEDLLDPHFKLSYPAALRARFVRNYWAIYMVLLFSWLMKIIVHSPQPHGWKEIKGYLAAGFLPWWTPLAYIALFLCAGAVLFFGVRRERRVEDEYWYADRELDVSTLDV